MGYFGRQWNGTAASLSDAPAGHAVLILVKLKKWLRPARQPVGRAAASAARIIGARQAPSWPARAWQKSVGTGCAAPDPARQGVSLSVILPERPCRLRVVPPAGGRPATGFCLPERFPTEATMLRKLALISAVSAFAVGTALAQSPNPPASSDSPAMKSDSMKQDTPSTTTSSTPSAGKKAEFVASQKPDQFLASKFKGTDVLGSDNQKIGDVSDILFDKNGKIEAYVVSVGGFLGIGAKDVALAPTAFQMMPGDPNSATDKSPKLKTSMSKDQLKEAANFEPYKEPRATTGTGGGAPRPSGSSGGMSK